VPKPLDDIVVDFVLSQKRETAELDFKLTLDVSKGSDFAEIAKDIFAMSNYGGGYMVFGYRETETGSFKPEGLPESFHIDQATLQEKFNSYSSEPITLEYKTVEKEIEKQKKRFAILYVPPSHTILKPIKYATHVDRRTGRERKVFSRDEILIRRGSQSVAASLNEIKFIEKRSRETVYKIGLLSGEPDQIKENLFGNFFRVVRPPSYVFEAQVPPRIFFSYFETKYTPYVKHGQNIYSFCDLDQEPFKKYILDGSLKKHTFRDFSESRDGQNLLIQLFNTEIRYEALNRRLRFAKEDDNIFFYPTDRDERSETWKSRYKKTSRLVAQKIYLEKLNRSLFVHDAALLVFHFLGTDIYLNIVPTIVLTHDGYESIRGFREGSVKTSLSYDKYNSSYLSSVLFWISRFNPFGERHIDLGKRISISAEPVTISLNVGIRRDRPSKEFHDRKEELYSFEEVP
jgi:hypothetical protein